MTLTPQPFLNIAIVGTGPTGVYALDHLLQGDRPVTITLFEAGRLAGVGSPYSPETAGVTMLANIASIEIPPLQGTYLKWLHRQPEAILQLYGVDPAALDERKFLPRLLLGAWFRDQLEQMLLLAPQRGHRVALREASTVTDVEMADDQVRVSFETAAGLESLLFTHVILATGHRWPEDDPDDHHRHVSPWSGLIDAAIPAVRVGVLGTSLSAIDAAMAVACQHGRFEMDDTAFALAPGSEPLCITLMSRQGCLPEADFWCPLPYRPLQHFTDTALEEAVRAGNDGLLDRLWRLMVTELAASDPVWAHTIGLAHLPLDQFASVYFAPRLATDPFLWAEANLAEVERNAEARRTVGWRYAILRMHEPMERMVEHFTEADRNRFAELKRVFIDNYAAVPPQSIRRLLALHRAGCLTVLALGEDYDLAHEDRLTRVRTEAGEDATFDVFIDARGQRQCGAADLPFPGLRQALPDGDVAMDPSFALRDIGQGRVFLPAAPYLLARLPFVQGITASADMASRVAQTILGEDSGD